ncbi:MAG: three-Cys-motif partner protein TcmP [Lachnospiraceae bacterium]|nr:three-Cys-motif partner protein TcmP [Lachnospiraceae bacterium]
MSTSNFFEKQTLSSRVKASIVAEYFPSYAKIISSKHVPRRIGYYDLFAGPGKYDDGNPSTPILLARNCVKDRYLRERVWMVFNDKEYKEALEQNFTQEFPTGTFTQKIYFRDQEVGSCQGINTFLVTDTMENGKNECPAVLFIDPFGYKNIDTSIIAKFLSFWGNEAFIFINTKRINPAFENDKFDLILRELFPSSYEETKVNIRLKRTVAERLQYIIDSLGREYQKLVPVKGREQVYYTAFKFQEEDSVTTSHYILHITKSRRGFDLIKQIYTDFANVGTIFDGVNTYTFDPKLGSRNSSLDLFDTKSENIDVLKETLYSTFKGQILTAFEVFESHQIKTLYSRNHYTEALRRLVNEGRVTSWYTDGKQHKVSVLLNESCYVKF